MSRNLAPPSLQVKQAAGPFPLLFSDVARYVRQDKNNASSEGSSKQAGTTALKLRERIVLSSGPCVIISQPDKCSQVADFYNSHHLGLSDIFEDIV